MTRKDSEKDSERPHYYSQFWLDVAAGRRIIGAPRSDEEMEPLESEAPEEPMPLRKAGRAGSQEDFSPAHSTSDRRGERLAHPVAEPEIEDEEFDEPETDELELDTEDIEDLDLPGVVVEDAEIPDVDLSPVDEEEEENFEDEEEEDEEDIGWGGGRGRKKAKPTRQPVKPIRKPPGKRDTRRNF